MACYGWTIDQALAITLPQANMLFRTMGKYPPIVAVTGAIFGNEVNRKMADAALGKIARGGEGAVQTAAGAAFWDAVGLRDKDNG